MLERESVPLGSMGLRLDSSAAAGTLVRRDLYDVRVGTLTALYKEDDADRASRVELFTGTTDAYSSSTSGAFALGEPGQQAQGAERSGQVATAAPTPTSVIQIEGESAAPAAVSTPEPSVAVDTEPDTTQVFVTTSLFAFPGDTEADTWFETQRDGLLTGATTGAGTFTEVPEAPSLGDAAATFATRRSVGAGEQAVGGFRMYSRLGAIVAVLDIESSAERASGGRGAAHAVPDRLHRTSRVRRTRVRAAEPLRRRGRSGFPAVRSTTDPGADASTGCGADRCSDPGTRTRADRGAGCRRPSRNPLQT